MATKTYISRIARHQIVTKPTTKRLDGGIEPGKVIEFQDNRYTTDDPKEQQAIERSFDFGRLIFVEGAAPPTPQQQKDKELEALRGENARLTEQLAALGQRLQQIEQATIAKQEPGPAPEPKAKGKQAEKPEPQPATTIPKGQKCEELVAGKACPDDAVAEVDGMFLCEKHAKESGKDA